MGKICHLVRHRDPFIQKFRKKVRLDLRTCSSMTHFNWISSFYITHNFLIREHTVNFHLLFSGNELALLPRSHLFTGWTRESGRNRVYSGLHAMQTATSSCFYFYIYIYFFRAR